MNIFVCLKQVPDTETEIVPKSDGNYIETDTIKWVMNPYDEYAVEQALQVKAQITGSVVTLIRVGEAKNSEALRTAMAMGADDSILIEANDELDPYMTAKAIKGGIEKSGKTPDLIFTGKQGVDFDNLQVPGILAQLLDLPLVTEVTRFEMKEKELTLGREGEGGGSEIYTVNTPAIVACGKGLNTPRYSSLPGLMKAKKKPLVKYTLGDVGVSDKDQRIKYFDFHLPPEKPPGKKFDATDENTRSQVIKEVVNLLRDEAKVI